VGRFGVACLLAALALGACGKRAAMPRACIEAQSEDVLQALGRAPGVVALGDGTRLSDCVAYAIDDARLQALGATLTTAADRLAARMHDGGPDGDADARLAAERAALQLGFLAGAVTRGAARTAGFQGDLADRIAGTATIDGGARRAALLRGREAGRSGG